ncbi:Uncharacterized protein dnm_032260 [Desulfonema magnum]|uniref:Uncharacterized protein n=1 Tax=Desulfonema magnum TaxID=45655 RepID=A0A975BKJ6_9BACT|nr:Uncharacterized protein dnm_032260 [Desulfonema magnum]
MFSFIFLGPCFHRGSIFIYFNRQQRRNQEKISRETGASLICIRPKGLVSDFINSGRVPGRSTIFQIVPLLNNLENCSTF